MQAKVRFSAGKTGGKSGEQSSLGGVRARMLEEYRQDHRHPWVVAYSGGLEGLIESGFEAFEPLMEFRDWLQELRENKDNRMTVRRDGSTKFRNGKRVYGPFTMETRKEILDKLQKLEAQTGKELISREEIMVIHDVWDRDSAVYETFGALRKMLRFPMAA